MNLLRRSYALGGAVALLLVFVGGDVSAQAVSVAFSPVDGVAPVSLSPWAMGLMGFLMALLAWRELRQKSPGRSWPLVLLASLGLMFFGALKPRLPEAVAAVGANSFNLAFPSPTDSPFLAYNQDISVVNATSRAIKLDAIRGPYDVLSYRIPSLSTPECQEGLVLSQNAICYLRIAPAL
jgi:hypothetical protein